MDVKLFLEGQAQWEEDSPHHLAIMQEMFQHAAAKGWKEAEQIVCQGHQQKLLQLNLETGVPAIQLVGPETSKEELCRSYTWRFTNCTDFQGLLLGNQHYLKRCCPPQRLPRAEGGKGICSHSEAPSGRPPSLEKCSPQKGKKGQLGGEESGHCMWGPPKSAGHGGYPWRRNRKIKLHPELPGSEGEIQEQGLPGM